MDLFSTILNASERTVAGISDAFLLKVGVCAIMLIMQKHVLIFFLFTLLVVLDLVSKFITLSYQMLVTDGDEAPTLYDSVRNIPEAHRAGGINSQTMKTQFIGKIIIYMLLVAAGGAIDQLLYLAGRNTDFAILCIAYLSATELLSIVENLDEAGVSTVHGLATLIHKKMGM